MSPTSTPASTPCPAPTAPANVLSIAGTDPTGGAGIQADLKTFGALGAYGMAVVTAVVAQNTQAVRMVSPLTPELVQAQLEAVFEDVTVAAVKIGMVANAGIAEAIAEVLTRHRPPFVVFDPVMAARLLGIAQPADEAGMRACLPALQALGVPNVLLKGGHLADDTPDAPESTDLLATPEGVIRLSAPRIATRHGHGTGCTLSSAIAALWPQHGLEKATRMAKDYVHGALLHADALQVGHGRGPLHHFWQAVHLPGQLA